MKEETAKEFYEALRRSCEKFAASSGVKITPESVMKSGLSIYPNAPMPGGPKKVPERVRKSLTNGGVLAMFQMQPEPNEEEKSRWLTLLSDLPFLIRSAFQEAGKKLPHRPGGAPRKLKTRAQERQACDALASLLSRGVEKPDAILQVARRYKVSTKTIRRAWKQHKNNIPNKGDVKM